VGVHDRFVGEPGNDDLGAMSARYVWASLGLYPSVPGTSTLTVNTPLFDRVEIALPADKSIWIPRRVRPGIIGCNISAACTSMAGRLTRRIFHRLLFRTAAS
jgi:hypothetical protein